MVPQKAYGGRMSKIHDRLKDFINLSLCIMIALVTCLFSKDKLIELVRQNSIHGTLTILLLSTTVCLFFLYWKAVRVEIDLIDMAFNTDDVKHTNGFVFIEAIALGVIFAVLIYLSTNILYYSVAVLIYSNIDLYGQANVIRHINIYIKENKIRKPFGEDDVEILSDYYIKRPLLTKISLTLTAFCIALIFSVMAYFEHNILYEDIAYCIVILAIIIGELFIRNWRKSRDKRLDEASKKRISTNS